MRARSILVMLGLIGLIMIGVQTLAEPTKAIAATVDIDPDTFNLKREGSWITAYIQLPDHNVEAIDISTVMLGNVHADWGRVEGDALMVKFDNANVAAYLEILLSHMGIVSPGKKPLELTVTGNLKEGAPFTASDTITILIP